MKIPSLKIEKIPLTKKQATGREWLNGVHFDKSRKCLFTSDGFMAARVPVEVSEDDVTGPIPLEHFKEMRKLGAGHINTSEVCEESPQATRDFIHNHIEGKLKHSIITLDAKRLYQLAQAICKKDRRTTGFHVKLYLPRVNEPLVVLPIEGDAAGLLMEIQSPPSFFLRSALDELTVALENDDPIDADLREKLRQALCE